MRLRPPVARLVVLAPLLACATAASALAVSDAGLRCQAAIGGAGRSFAATRLKAFVACNNAVAGGDTCDVSRREQVVARAARALLRRIVGACSEVALGELDFPGACPDTTGGDFVLNDLTRCIADTHEAATDSAIQVDYPRPGLLFGPDRRCQRGLGRAASAFVATAMRARTRCLDARLRGAVPADVDCRAAIPPYGPGTGDDATDGLIAQATARLVDRISEACFRADLAALGFPGACPDPVPGAPTLADVERCVRATHEHLTQQMLAAEYPPPAAPTPMPTATPRLVLLNLLPANAQRVLGGFQNYTARGTFNDGSERNLTQRVSYVSSDPSVAVCPNEEGNRGRVSAVGIGTTSITATEPVTGVTSPPVTLTVVACDPCTTNIGIRPTNCHPCVTKICAADPSCCADAFTQACVDAVGPICGESCPAAP
jgi:hypothetical protein